ncbi:hypothetical protein [Legionella septentrionalis]|uniref:Uncharacterized protein n=1 Tax=Legionella septentrionalis TaxID=2498109 RepID=A0A3S0VP59_9GAMM|nr:hypothetical protein [Legionella septentrionalis]RUQ90752.1 hypothetical protein EKM59_01405 [Legionella septentrionalis]RUQ99943.1 hypothetical protein ELY11_03600 [Legionella septentrionalis]RUR15775.1 hypothetical protein ELY10_04945 [Legionella septentrionalis]
MKTSTSSLQSASYELNDARSSSNAVDAEDLLFTLKFIPRVLLNSVKFGACGMLLGWGCAYNFAELWKSFLTKHSQSVHGLEDYVPDDQRFLHMSRNQHFNQVTPSIASIAPTVGLIVGAGFGIWYGASKKTAEFMEDLNADRAERKNISGNLV